MRSTLPTKILVCWLFISLAFADNSNGLSREEIKKYVEEDYETANKNVKKTTEDGIKVYAHVHHSPATESDKLVFNTKKK